MPKIFPSPCADFVDVFTDGSAYFQDRWDCCLSGMAVIRVSFVANNWSVVASQILPYREHSAYRAESYAVMRTLQRFYRVRIFVDCSSVVRNLKKLLRCRDRGRSMPSSACRYMG